MVALSCRNMEFLHVQSSVWSNGNTGGKCSLFRPLLKLISISLLYQTLCDARTPFNITFTTILLTHSHRHFFWCLELFFFFFVPLSSSVNVAISIHFSLMPTIFKCVFQSFLSISTSLCDFSLSLSHSLSLSLCVI